MPTVYESILGAMKSVHSRMGHIFQNLKSDVLEFNEIKIDTVESEKRIPQLSLEFPELIFEGNKMHCAIIDVLCLGESPEVRFIEVESIQPFSAMETVDLVFNYIKPRLEKYIKEYLEKAKKAESKEISP